MTDIPWGEQPTPEYVYVVRHRVSGWMLEAEAQALLEYTDAKIHRKPEPKAFEPVVGTRCEMLNPQLLWKEVDIIAIHLGYMHGWCNDTKTLWYSNDLTEFRPIKSEEQVFIEKALNLVYEVEPTVDDVLCAMHKAGFKAPEGDL